MSWLEDMWNQNVKPWGTAIEGAANTVGTATKGATNAMVAPVAQLGADLGGEGFWPQNASAQDVQQIKQQLDAAGISESDPRYQQIIQDLAAGRLGPAGAFNQIELARNRTAGMGELQGLEDTIGANLQGRVNRFQGVVSDPSKIRTDAELGRVLAQAEGQAHAGVREAQRQGAQRASARGTGFSGKSLDMTERARESGRGQILNTQATLHGLAQTGLNEAQNTQGSFLTGLANSRDAVRQNTMPDFITDQGNQFALRAANRGAQQKPIDQAFGLFRTIAGEAVDKANQFASMPFNWISSKLPGGKP